MCTPTACPCPNKKQQRGRQRGEAGREQAKAADMPRQIKVRNADGKAKKVEKVKQRLAQQEATQLRQGEQREEQGSRQMSRGNC